MTAGYFDAPAETKPLLHTWSLGVEEQFYLIAPVLMLLIYRIYRNGPKRCLRPPPCCRLRRLGRQPSQHRFRVLSHAVSRLGTGIGRAVVDRVHPGAEHAAAKKHLWHRGIVAAVRRHPAWVAVDSATADDLARERRRGAGDRLQRARNFMGGKTAVAASAGLRRPDLLFAVSVALAADRVSAYRQRVFRLFVTVDQAGADPDRDRHRRLSWKFVELPVPHPRQGKFEDLVFGTAAAAMASSRHFVALWSPSGGAPFRFPPRVVAIGAYLAYDPSSAFRAGHCYLGTNREQLDMQTCMKLDPARPNYLLVGDSHAAHLWLGLSSAMPDVNILQATASACRPAIVPVSSLDLRACPKLMRFVFNDFLVRHKVDRVLLSASWKDEDIPALADTLEVLKEKGIEVTVLGPIVEYDGALPRLSATIRYNNPSLARDMRTPGILRARPGAEQAGRGQGRDLRFGL